jgi:hypothetical protein
MEKQPTEMNIEERIKQRIEQIAVDKSASPSDWRWIEGYMLEGYKIAIEEHISNHWTSPCICPPDEKTGEMWCCNLCGKPTARTESKELPGDDDAGVIAANVASNVRPKLTTQEEAFFIAGFTECVKYLRTSPLLASKDARIRELEEALKSIQSIVDKGYEPDFNFEYEHWDNGNYDDSCSYGVDTGMQYVYKEILNALTPPKN